MSLLPSSVDRKILEDQVMALREAGRDAEAVQPLLQLREAWPGHAAYADHLLQLYIALRRWPEAEEATVLAIARHGAPLSRLNRLARCRWHLGQAAEIRTMFLPSPGGAVPDAQSHLLLVLASFGLGDVATALGHLEQLVAMAGPDMAKHDSALSRLLAASASRGGAAPYFAIVDGGSRIGTDRNAWLKAGIKGADFFSDWPRKLDYARRLRADEPQDPQAAFHELDALISLSRFDEAKAALAAARQAPSAAMPEDRLEGLARRIDAAEGWVRHIAPSRQELSFEALNLRLCAGLALRRYDEAREVAELAIRTLGRHSWFLSALARCKLATGEPEEGLLLLAEAADGGGAYHLVRLAQARLRLGQRGEALDLVQRLQGTHSGVYAVEKMARELGDVPPPVATPAVAPPGPETWLHGGDHGDLIYALAAMQSGGGGTLYLTPYPETRDAMDERKIEFLRPMLLAQSYIAAAEPWRGQAVTRDFLLVRQGWRPDSSLFDDHWRAVLPSAPEPRRAWLSIPDLLPHGRPVFSRSGRYRNPAWDAFWTELKASALDAIFVGTRSEFDEFGHGEHFYAEDALAMGRVIAGASIFVGNQSFPYAVAEGLKVGRLLEVCPAIRNCSLPGALALAFDP